MPFWSLLDHSMGRISLEVAKYEPIWTSFAPACRRFVVDSKLGTALDDRTKTILTAMRKVLRVAQANSKTLIRETGLTPSQLIFLQLLDDGHEKTAGVIATRMGITQATTTALTHKLEALGFVTRRRGETDRRHVWLALSDKGRAVLAIAPDGVHTRFHQRFIQLKDWEQAMLIAALERVADMLGPADLDAETLEEGVENALELPSFRIEGN